MSETCKVRNLLGFQQQGHLTNKNACLTLDNSTQEDQTEENFSLHNYLHVLKIYMFQDKETHPIFTFLDNVLVCNLLIYSM